MDEPRAGRSSPFDEIFQQFRDPIYSYIYHLMGSAEDAEDFTQDTFVKAYVALPNTPDDLKLKPWLYRIATNVCLEIGRAHV